MRNLWNKDLEQNSQQLIDYLIGEYLPEGKGFRNIPRNIIALSELGYSSKENMPHSEVSRILKKMIEGGMSLVSDFERIYYEDRESEVKDRRMMPLYSMYIPFHMEISRDIVLPFTIKIMDIEFIFNKLESIECKEDIAKKINQYSEEYHIYTMEDQLYVCIDRKALNWANAMDEMASAFDILRGIILYNIEVPFRLFSTTMDPRAKIPHPYILISKNNDDYEYIMFMVDQIIPPAKFTMSKSLLDAVIEMSEIFKGRIAEKTTISLCGDSLRIYAQSMESRFHYNCFLGLWQMAENMTLAESYGGNTDEVCKKLYTIINPDLVGSGYKHLLKHFAKLRNTLVHKGLYYDVEEHDVDILELICRLYFQWLLSVRDKLPTIGHIRHFYSLNANSPDERKNILSVINFIDGSNEDSE